MARQKNNYIKCTPSSLVQKFRMDQENYNFKRQEFIDEFSKQFLEALENYPYKNPKTSLISYNNHLRPGIHREKRQTFIRRFMECLLCSRCNSY